MSRRYRVTITAPSGSVLDVTERLDLDNLGSVSSSLESDLTIYAHGDFSMTIRNADGVVEAFLSAAGPDDLYEVVLDRMRPGSNSWDRLFGGVLNLPYGVAYDDVAKKARVDAYGYTKQLERTPATDIRRSIASKTASIALDSASMLFLPGEANDLYPGDVVRLNTGLETAEFTVARIIDDRNVIVTEPSGAAYNTVFVEVLTPYHRDLDPGKILGFIADETGLDVDFNARAELASFPVATPYTLNGLVLGLPPISLVPATITGTPDRPGFIATHKNIDGGPNRRTSTGPTAAWVAGAASNRFQADWTPYLLAEPVGNIYDRALGVDPSMQADSNVQYVPGTLVPSYYLAECVAYTTGTGGTVAGNRWQLFIDDHLVGGTSWSVRLTLYKDGVPVKIIEDLPVGGIRSLRPTFHGWIEWDTFNHVPWVSYQVIAYGDTAPTIRKLMYYTDAAGGTFTVIDATHSGQLRLCRSLGVSGHMAFFDCAIEIAGPQIEGTLRLYDLDVGSPLGSAVRYTLGLHLVTPLLWTFRNWSIYFAFLEARPDGTYVRIFLEDGFVPLASYKVSSLRESTGFLTYQTFSNGDTSAVGFAGREWFVLSVRYDGVIRYANFKEASCAKAIRDIAVLVSAVVDVTPHRTVEIASRRTLGSGDVVADLDASKTQMRRPNSELYRTSVVVNGTDSNGGAISETQGADGNLGDSARRLSVDCDLVSTPGMALACAISTLQFVSQIREQRDVTVRDDGRPLRVLQRVTMRGRDWLVYKLDTDLEREIHSMMLLELAP